MQSCEESPTNFQSAWDIGSVLQDHMCPGLPAMVACRADLSLSPIALTVVQCTRSLVSWHLRDISRLTRLHFSPKSNASLETQIRLITNIALNSPDLACLVFGPPSMYAVDEDA